MLTVYLCTISAFFSCLIGIPLGTWAARNPHIDRIMTVIVDTLQTLPSFVYHGHAIRNHNRLLGQVDGVDGIKTGYTHASGFNLVTSMRRGDRHIVAVVLGGRSGGQRDARMRSLISEHIMLASAKPSTPTRVAEAAPRPLPFPFPLPFLNPAPEGPVT